MGKWKKIRARREAVVQVLNSLSGPVKMSELLKILLSQGISTDYKTLSNDLQLELRNHQNYRRNHDKS